MGVHVARFGRPLSPKQIMVEALENQAHPIEEATGVIVVKVMPNGDLIAHSTEMSPADLAYIGLNLQLAAIE